MNDTLDIADRPQDGALHPQRQRPRQWWRASRYWLTLLGLTLIGAVLLTAASNRSAGHPLDPTSASRSGSQALARLLQARGTRVQRSTDIGQVAGDGTVLITDPAVYSAPQLQSLAASHRLVLIAPTAALLAALDPSLADAEDDAASLAAGDVSPLCSDAGALAAGIVNFEASDISFDRSQCYDGRVLITPRLVAIGDPTRLTNESLADRGVAALDLNLISADGQVERLTWLMSELDPSATPDATVWTLFPDWTPHAVLWLSALGLLTALWRGRRLAPVVLEPLPVVVRGSEVVRGHARLYRRAAAREHAALALHRATRERLALRMGLRRSAPHEILLATLPPGEAAAFADLLDAAPASDAEFVRLAQRLSLLEADHARIELTEQPTTPDEGLTS